jgi:putative redox protein
LKSSEEKWLAEVSWSGENVFLGSDTSGHTVVYDSNDGVMKGIGPMRALLTALGACTGMDIVAILKKRKQKLTSLRVLLSGERPEYGLPKPWTSIHIKYVLSGDKLSKRFVEEAIKESTEKFCSVGASLSPTAKITHSYEIRSSQS